MSIGRCNDSAGFRSRSTQRPHALSRAGGLTLDEAAYLELAIRRALPLATCDADLIAAARRRAVEALTA
ncbi:hypothetical protein DFR50_11078 [Roseiarcus fermentans]|uniref:PIN domain-containing protein n=1 Tax=Roseiarcus fermentans TaxID=1473586 RepID=A0A366FHA7_9HYPH|nr:hypothetical protein [Roseiarcus fermentans]RBP14054.1 hypothetical protein DFR50_11078 [Roseiarcus fermentans]